MIILEGKEPSGGAPGDCVFKDGMGLDGSIGTEALRLCDDGRFLVRGVLETDHVKIVRALCDWTVRILDAKHAPTTDTGISDEPIEPAEGRVTISTQGSLTSIVMENDGEIYVNGSFAEHDDKLRRNFRRVLERLRVNK